MTTANPAARWGVLAQQWRAAGCRTRPVQGGSGDADADEQSAGSSVLVAPRRCRRSRRAPPCPAHGRENHGCPSPCGMRCCLWSTLMCVGDPMSPLRWTCKSIRKLAAELTRQGAGPRSTRRLRPPPARRDRFPDRVFAFDEFGPLGTRPTAGSCWAKQGKPNRLPATCRRTHGVTCFHGCYSVGDDRLWGVNHRRKGTANTLAALKSGFALFRGHSRVMQPGPGYRCCRRAAVRSRPGCNSRVPNGAV